MIFIRLSTLLDTRYLLVKYLKLDLHRVAYFRYPWLEENALKEVYIFRDHRNHIHLPCVYKRLQGIFQIGLFNKVKITKN